MEPHETPPSPYLPSDFNQINEILKRANSGGVSRKVADAGNSWESCGTDPAGLLEGSNPSPATRFSDLPKAVYPPLTERPNHMVSVGTVSREGPPPPGCSVAYTNQRCGRTGK